MLLQQRYDLVQRLLHWSIAAIVLSMIGLGLFMVELPKQSELPPGEESVRAFYFLLHKSLGLTAAILIAIRIVWRLTHKAPPLPDTISKLQQRAASVVHWLLYFLMIAMPVSGYMQSMYSKYPTKFWGIKLPRTAEADNVMRANFTEVHEILAFAFIAVLIVHIGAAIKHKFDGSGVMQRMSLFK
jgi:cytochrome b561